MDVWAQARACAGNGGVVVKENPIPFKAETVRAILEGRKTQTRWVIKPQPEMARRGKIERWEGDQADLLELLNCSGRNCPFGQVGDILWVRETWQTSSAYDYLSPRKIQGDVPLWFKADKNAKKNLGDQPGRTRPSIHMPRWASRITLEITGVRVERVQDISEEDARAEGIVWKREKGDSIDPRTERAAKPIFPALWDAINAERGYGYEVNPWVWVIEFKVVQS